MFEVGKSYAQFCRAQNEEFVFLEKIEHISDEVISTLGILIEEDGLTFESSCFSPAFDDEYFVALPDSLFEELHNMFGDGYEIIDESLAIKYIAIFKEMCKCHWRDIAKEDKQNESNAI